MDICRLYLGFGESWSSVERLTPKRRTYDREIRLSIDTQFCHLYGGKTESLHFQQMKDCIYYEL